MVRAFGGAWLGGLRSEFQGFSQIGEGFLPCFTLAGNIVVRH
jgi:hypothetical protein